MARYPPPDRDGARLLHLGERVTHHPLRALPDLLLPGDLLVVNDTRVMPARIRARRRSGASVELLLLGPGPGEVAALARPARRLKIGEILDILDPSGETVLPGLSVRLGERLPDGAVLLQATPSVAALMAQAGAMPIPPYLNRPAEPLDALRYQTVYANQPGSVAAPTAGLHLTETLLRQLVAKGVEIAQVTLHVGAGTFRNLRPEDLDAGRLHVEHYAVTDAAAAQVAACRARGGRVIAVGTTSARTLESAALGAGQVAAGTGRTSLFVRPGYRFQVVDLLLTNLHLPRSSLLMLVCALGGRDRVMAAYEEAVRQGYRFFSYGDAMLVEAPAPGTD